VFGPHAILDSKSSYYDKTARHCSTGRVIDFRYLQGRRTGTPPETQKIVDGSPASENGKWSMRTGEFCWCLCTGQPPSHAAAILKVVIRSAWPV
jgi:hypothetical protein